MGVTYDVIDVLLDDHQLLEGLLERLDREERPAEMRVLFFRIADELAAHEAAECDVLFPAARAALPSPGQALLDLAAEHGPRPRRTRAARRRRPGRQTFGTGLPFRLSVRIEQQEVR